MTVPHHRSRRRRWRPSRVIIIVVVVAMLAMWGYVLYLAFGPGRQAPPDRLADPAFAIAAQARCDAALDEVADAAGGQPVHDAGRSGRRGGGRPTTSSPPCSTTSPTCAAPARTASSCGSGWPTGAPTSATAQDYADALRTDPEARLLVSAKDGEQITEFLDAFAADNRMPACSTPDATSC